MTSLIETKPFIREASLLDVETIQRMFRTFVQSSQYARYVGDSPDHALASIERLVMNDETSVIFVVDAGDDGLIGMLGLVVYEHPFSGDIVAVEAFWWLHPERRGHGAFLLRKGEKWARAKGAIRMDLMQPCDKPRVGEIYQALGFSAIEITWRKNL